MDAIFDVIAHDALVLPAEQRVALAYRLLVSVEPAPSLGAEPAWDAEIADRVARFDSGATQTVTAEDVFARLTRIAPER
jgi:putative addiction module component (TIGR02574 family)